MISKVSLVVFWFFFSFPFLTTASGMNRVVLKQGNATGNKNQLKQEMFCQLVNGKRIPYTNTIFVIQSDFELAESITIPDDCVLEFEGGCLRNGSINTNGCYIDAGLYQVFDKIVFNSLTSYSGLLELVDNIYIKVLKAESFVNKKTNTVIQANAIVNRRYTYRITGKGTTPSVEGTTVTINLNGQKYTIAEVTSDKKYKLKYDYSQVLGITNATGEMTSGIVNSLKGITFYSIAPLTYSNNSTVKNKAIHPEWFGAKGDNVNDDSYAFNSALDLAYYSDSKVVIGNGIYRIDDALVIHTHTNLEGVVPMAEIPIKGYFSVNTDVAMLVFDKYNPTGCYVLQNIGFRPFSEKYSNKYTGIRIHHSQNHAKISNVGFFLPKTGIEIDAIGGVQLLRCEDISLWGEENKENIALFSKQRLGGWFNANYFRPAFIAHGTVIRCNGGANNTLDGGSCETNSYSEYLVELDDKATLIVRGGLYKETGRFAKLRNSSTLIIEGDSYIIGNVDCDASSYVVNNSRNVQSRQNVINNTANNNDVVLAHYKVFPLKPTLWYETIKSRIIKPLETTGYEPVKYNGRLFASGYCKIPMGDIDIKGKTVVIRIISPTAHSSSKRDIPFIINDGISGQTMKFSQASWLDNTSVLYAPTDVNLGAVDKGEKYVFLPSKNEKYLLNNFTSVGDQSLLISDIFIINIDAQEIDGNEELRILDVLNYLDTEFQVNGFILGYNKGTSYNRPTDLTREDEGFEYFDTTLHKPIYWIGDTSIGDNGWVDAMGGHPSRK